MMPKAKATEKEGTLDFIEVENVCVSKDTIEEIFVVVVRECGENICKPYSW